MIDLRCGRPCVAWEDNVDHVKGHYIKYGSHEQEHWILDDTGSIMPFQHVKPDLDATPMNGDEVEGYTDRKIGTGRYVGIMADGRHLIETEMGSFLFCDSVHLPQPSKRDRVIETLKTHEEIVTANIVTRSSLEKLADEILKITEDE